MFNTVFLVLGIFVAFSLHFRKRYQLLYLPLSGKLMDRRLILLILYLLTMKAVLQELAAHCSTHMTKPHYQMPPYKTKTFCFVLQFLYGG